MTDLSLYIHIPFCHRRCPYCSFYHVSPASADEGAFVDALTAEISRELAALPETPRLGTVFFGGGTPTVMSDAGWRKVFEEIEPYLPADPASAEITCEVNPEDVTEARLDTLSGHGVNRVSIGIQSMDPADQRTLGRCTPDVNRRAIDRILGRFDNVSFDVLLGVPGRAISSFDATLAELTAHRPAHFSVYCLEPGGDMAGEVERFFDSVDAERSADEYRVACRRFADEGFRHYEVSNFARSGQESMHNRVYWDGGEYLGVGPAAHSYLGGKRFHNPPSLVTWVELAHRPGDERWIHDEADPGARETERVMLALRTDRGLPVESLSCSPDTVNAILEEGLAAVTSGQLTLTDRGYLLLDEIALRLLKNR
jgi:oxygen-independent coproporphyrinogen-3 oxidase